MSPLMMLPLSVTDEIERWAGPGVVTGMLLASLVTYLLMAVAMWKMLDKAGQPGWFAFIPVLNLYAVLRAANRPGWWLLLYLIPVVGTIVAVVVAFDLGEAFRRSAMFSLFLLFLFPFFGYLILGFGEARYTRPVRA